jgi:3-oxoacyl-[acyl-carrier protein] reductase
MIGDQVPAERRVALVTGSSRGLGAAIARRLAHDGLSVAVNGAHGDTSALEVVAAIRADGGVAEVFTADVTDELQVDELVAAVAGGLGPVVVLVLNATGPQPEAPLAEVTWEDHLAQLEFFVKSPVLLLRAVLPGMEAKQIRPHRPDRLRGREPAATREVGLCHREERTDRSRPWLGA